MKKICFLILLTCCCIYFSNIAQPSSVTAGEWFNIVINGHYTQGPGCGGAWWLAMMMPIGTDIDSIIYTSSGGQTGVVTEIDTLLSDWFASTHPCDTNMCWLVCSTRNLESESLGTFTANIYAYAADTIATGEFLIDYYIGYRIDCGITYYDSLLDLPMTVNPAGIAQGAASAVNAEQKIYPTLFHDRLNIYCDEPSTFNIYSSCGRLIKSLRVQGSDFWDGRDARGVKMPSGDYFLVGNSTRIKVILVE